MSKELTKEEAEEFYNKLWLENKELIQENIDKINTEIFELELELVDKDKEIERLNKIINELEKDLEDRYYGRGKYHMDTYSIGIKDILDKLQELKGSDKE